MWEINGNLQWVAGGYQGLVSVLSSWFVSLPLPVCDWVYLGVHVPDTQIWTHSAHGIFSFVVMYVYM